MRLPRRSKKWSNLYRTNFLNAHFFLGLKFYYEILERPDEEVVTEYHIRGLSNTQHITKAALKVDQLKHLFNYQKNCVLNGMEPDQLSDEEVKLTRIPMAERRANEFQLRCVTTFKNILARTSQKRIIYNDSGVLSSLPFGHSQSNVRPTVVNEIQEPQPQIFDYGEEVEVDDDSLNTILDRELTNIEFLQLEHILDNENSNQFFAKCKICRTIVKPNYAESHLDKVHNLSLEGSMETFEGTGFEILFGKLFTACLLCPQGESENYTELEFLDHLFTFHNYFETAVLYNHFEQIFIPSSLR